METMISIYQAVDWPQAVGAVCALLMAAALLAGAVLALSAIFARANGLDDEELER
jgi:hypothetical protein